MLGMDFHPVARAADAYQRSVTAGQIEAAARRAFGDEVRVTRAVELGDGTYNSTYRVAFAAGPDAILRVAPEPGRQFRAERGFMRNEHAAMPYFAPVAALMPRVLAVDFTHEVIGRDYMFQSVLDGVPAPEGLAAYPRTAWTSFFRGVGALARRIHAVRGPWFGPVAGPGFDSWSEALLAALDDIAADLDDANLDADDIRELIALAAAHRPVLDGVAEPRLLHGDLWTVNLMVVPGAPEPTVCGVFDADRAWWGDPESDWCIYRAAGRPGTERDAFWETYGPLADTPGAAWRRTFYSARNVAAARLERLRLGKTEEVAESYAELRQLLVQLGEGDG